MRFLAWSSLALGLSYSVQLVKARGIIDIRVTTCPEDNCVIPGYRKIQQDINKFSRGSFVHLHFTDVEQDEPYSGYIRSGCSHETVDNKNTDDSSIKNLRFHRRPKLPITHISVLQGEDADMGPDWERIHGNLNDGTHGPTLTMFVKRDPKQSPIESIVIKYGYDSHAAIGYDRLPMDLNSGTGGQWVYLYYKKAGSREPITHIATKACILPLCTLDDSWTRVNRPIITGTLKRYLYLFYKSVPGTLPITSIKMSLKEQNKGDKEDVDGGAIDTGVRYKGSNVYISYKRGVTDDNPQAIDNIAIQLGPNPVPSSWNATLFEHDVQQDVPDWDAHVIYRTAGVASPKKPTLRFKEDGSFKIVQFADIHMATGPHTCYNTPGSMTCIGDTNTMDMMERMLDAEKPDLVVYSGDNVDGLTSNDAFSTIVKYSRPVVERGIPWTIIFGNHDEEGDLSREEMMSTVQDLPYSLSQRGPLHISGTGNYVLSIHKHRRKRAHRQGFDNNQNEGEEETRLDDSDENDIQSRNGLFHLYFLDSGAYSFNLKYPGWDWIKEDQVEWFRQTSRVITSRYATDDIPNALAFFHIPIPEYNDLGDDNEDDDNDDDDLKEKNNVRMVGDKAEGVSAPSYNSGMFDAFLESKDVRATTAGHDHLNDYCLNHHGINLCYGGGLGYGTYGSPTIPRRSRVFEIRNNGDRVDTWKRLDDEDMTLVNQQTLFVGKKSPSSAHGRPSNGRSGKSTRPKNRQDSDLYESLRQGAQYVMNGLIGH